MSKDPKRPKKRRPQPDTPPHWERLYQAFRDAFEWALDVAASLARDYPEESEAVERVRVYMRKRLAGHPAHVRVDDVLLTFALLIGAIDRDLVRDLVRTFGSASSSGSENQHVRFPGADIWNPRIPRRFTFLALVAPWLGLGRTPRAVA